MIFTLSLFSSPFSQSTCATRERSRLKLSLPFSAFIGFASDVVSSRRILISVTTFVGGMAAVATGMLGNSSASFNQTWHLPTAADPPTAREWIDGAAGLMNAKPRNQRLTPFMAGLMGIFIPVLKEVKEMMYQYEQDYVFNSDKFNQAFGFTPTSYEEGLKAVIEADFS